VDNHSAKTAENQESAQSVVNHSSKETHIVLLKEKLGLVRGSHGYYL
jgi:hypothetical protein